MESNIGSSGNGVGAGFATVRRHALARDEARHQHQATPQHLSLLVCRLDLLCVLCVLCGSSLLISTTEDTEDTEKPQRTRGTGATPHLVDPKHFLSCCRRDSPLCRLQSSQFLSVLRGESLFRAKRERYQRRHGRSRHSSRLTHSKAERPVFLCCCGTGLVCGDLLPHRDESGHPF